MLFQFTPLREGRQILLQFASCWKEISIHAPPRGATRTRTGISSARFISIHAPPRGATADGVFLQHSPKFQFTPLREGRRNHQRIGSRRAISIHAPPRGATLSADDMGFSQTISIHAPPRGATALCHWRCRRRYPFQFTPLREGRRLPQEWYYSIYDISIHAPPRGATLLFG